MDKKAEEPKRTKSYINEAYRQILEKPNILDVVVLNKAGNPVKTTMEQQRAIIFSGYYELLRDRAQTGIQKIDPKDELQMLRIRTKAHEVFITPDGRATFIVVQNAEDNFQK